ncbi:unnamed protein product [Anisakis simplex]|uniref:Uncharacterized protein n=1 Tax=Anisakis simplex TaxID=6269 RepID=A0A0M3JPI2_ANISI|nr:unnamed protein product [Anisakis simplex]
MLANEGATPPSKATKLPPSESSERPHAKSDDEQTAEELSKFSAELFREMKHADESKPLDYARLRKHKHKRLRKH